MEQLGAWLKSIREEKGITIEEVSDATKIRHYYIESIEKGDMDALPGSAYALGFLKTYANFLHVDEKKVVDYYREKYPKEEVFSFDSPIEEQKDNAPRERKSSRRGKRDNQKQVQKRETTEPRRKEPRQRKVASESLGIPKKRSFGKGFIWIVVVVLVVAVAVYIYSLGKKDIADNDSDLNMGSQSATTGQEKQPEEIEPTKTTESKTKDEEDASQAKSDELTVEIEAKHGDCWLGIDIDGVKTEETLKKGDKRSFDGEEKIEIRYGNAGAVAVTFLGEKKDPLGKNGEVLSEDYELPDQAGKDKSKKVDEEDV